jgi:hypothetical protein|tara:strand:- start:451 stop:639 length:189 start_codon:yes stop_codon:yes gene_type:complete
MRGALLAVQSEQRQRLAGVDDPSWKEIDPIGGGSDSGEEEENASPRSPLRPHSHAGALKNLL